MHPPRFYSSTRRSIGWVFIALTGLLSTFVVGVSGGSANAATGQCGGKAATVYTNSKPVYDRGFLIGTAGNDVIVVGPRAASAKWTISGGGGDDIICGGAKADIINGGAGDDLILGKGGNDLISGGAGRDRVRAGSGDDRVTGGGGRDYIKGGPGSDTLDGGAGSDTIAGGAGNDSIRGGKGFDILQGGRHNDVIRGGDGNDKLWGGSGSDKLWGENGDDVIDANHGSVAVFGDSLCVGATAAGDLEAKLLAKGFTAAQITCRSSETAGWAIQQLSAMKTVPATVVVAMGTNPAPSDSVWRTNVAQLIRDLKAKGAVKISWLTAHTQRMDYGPRNTLMANIASANGVTVRDWAAALKGQPHIFSGDRVHYTWPSGQRVYAQYLTDSATLIDLVVGGPGNDVSRSGAPID